MYDNYSGLVNYGFRDYSPVAMRFTTVDPIRSGTNWYSYVGNDPINFVDPFGLLEVESADLNNNTSTSDRINGTYEENSYDSETHSIRANPDPITSPESDPFAEGIDNYNKFMEDHASLTARAGAGGAGHLSTSDVKNSIGAGTYIGAGAAVTLDFTFKISDMGATDKLDMMVGGSFDVGVSLGGEFVFTEDGTYVSLSIGFGVGTPEVHFIASDEIPVRCED
jgi:hypothetical protein